MTRPILTVVALTLVVASADLAAQPATKPNTDEKTLVGCLRQGRADTTTANAKGMIYTLEGPAEKLLTSPAPEGSGPVELAKTRYLLSFDKSADLSRHVDHQVQVTGHLLPQSAAPQSDATAAKPLPGAAQAMFHVSALKMLAPSCK